MPSRLSRVLLVTAAIILSGCGSLETKVESPSPSASPDPYPSPSPTATIRPSPTPSPPVEFIDLNVVSGEADGQWRALGLLENQSDRLLTEILLRVTLKDGTGASIAQHEVSPALHRISSGGRSPFIADFEVPEEPASTEVEVISFLEEDGALLDIFASSFEAHPTAEGVLAIIGTLRNAGDTPVEISDFFILVLGNDGLPVDLAPMEAGLTLLPPGDPIPYTASTRAIPAPLRFVPYFDAAEPESGPMPVQISLSQHPRIQLDIQSHPFVLGEVQNDDRRLRWASVLLAIEWRGEWISASQVLSPIPLYPGVQRGFAVADFPGLVPLLAGKDWDSDDLVVGAWLDPLASSPAVVRRVFLSLRIDSYGSQGGSLILSGNLMNPSPDLVKTPTVHASIRAEDGLLITSGWVTAAPDLESGGNIDFVLRLPHPEGYDLTESEYDVWAMGIVE